MRILSLPRSILIPSLVVVFVLLALAIAQLVLPGIAEQRVRDRLRHDGTVESVKVSAFPALKLLWGSADSVKVRIRQLNVNGAETGNLLGRSHGLGDVDVSIGRLSDGLLRLNDVSLRKRGSGLTARGALATSDLRAVLPAGFDVQPVASGNGQLMLRAQASLFGLGVGVNALLVARNGALVVEPVGIPLASLATLTVFSDPHVAVQGVGAAPSASGYTVTAQGRLL